MFHARTRVGTGDLQRVDWILQSGETPGQSAKLDRLCRRAATRSDRPGSRQRRRHGGESGTQRSGKSTGRGAEHGRVPSEAAADRLL